MQWKLSEQFNLTRWSARTTKIDQPQENYAILWNFLQNINIFFNFILRHKNVILRLDEKHLGKNNIHCLVYYVMVTTFSFPNFSNGLLI